ncbi:tRNA threonylcarbamoyladenosine dehydratase [endosymbiont 'TC1' of Trimyema compressum]|uniref:tRNA threonylcarbamoyladenosine dehydratase n=1 Tax=endosymbiont 'TC1' of Trimyema compressum TaxID=243899 RepID=UPI0007F06785|nr:tRNA threonylcarbamoyladenosine dehydratase [endosymbiont 'TC1' of Trimyema compressum]AMP20100.1 tRNA threonylcarbamoyladenosine dehydratase [endosymbiont 'TC1' of Trimyema compressum]
MRQPFDRTAMLLGTVAMEKLNKAHVIVFGVGGVGSFTVEALVRSGIGSLTLADNDTIATTNLNRQLHTTVDTIGESKVEVMAQRVLSINPEVDVRAIEKLYLPETRDYFFNESSHYDYIVDAIDTVTAKIDLAVASQDKKIPLISAMGAGNKLNPTQFRVGDIYETHTDPLAKVMRRELKKRGIKSLKVVYSMEAPVVPFSTDEITAKRTVPGSVAFVPSVEGLIIAGEVIKDLIK